jgi:G3E family GTPase
MSLPLRQVSPEAADALEARLRGINSMAQIMRAQRAAVGVDYVLGVGGFDLDRVEGEVRSFCSSSKRATCIPYPVHP